MSIGKSKPLSYNYLIFSASASIFSMKIPYPSVGSATITVRRRSASRMRTKCGTPKVFAPPILYGWGFAMQSSENLLNFSATQIQRLRCFWYYLILCRVQHIFYEYPIPLGGICDEDVCHRADKFAVLDNGAAGHTADDSAR